MVSDKLSECKHILSIDIGAINMAYVYCRLDKIDVDDMVGHTYVATTLIAKRVNIIDDQHKHICRDKCTLHHTSNWCDRVAHFTQELQAEIQGQATHPAKIQAAIDIVLIEKQPPLGFTQIEQLLVSHFRNKMILVNPISVHKFLGLVHGKSTREFRKIVAIKTGGPYLEHINEYTVDERKHDMADAMCMVLYHIRSMTNLVPIRKIELDQNLDLFFNKFRFR